MGQKSGYNPFSDGEDVYFCTLGPRNEIEYSGLGQIPFKREVSTMSRLSSRQKSPQRRDTLAKCVHGNQFQCYTPLQIAVLHEREPAPEVGWNLKL